MTTEQVPMTEQQHTLGLMIQWLRGISEPQTPGDRELDDEDLMFARAVLATLQQHERLTADLADANERIRQLDAENQGFMREVAALWEQHERAMAVVEAARRLIDEASGDIADGTASAEEKELHAALAALEDDAASAAATPAGKGETG